MGGNSESKDRLSRREFMGTAATAGLVLMRPELVRGTAANSDLRVGLLGCGGRGTADTTDLVNNGQCRVVALADLFQDQLDKAKDNFDKLGQSKGHSPIDSKMMFRGPKAFESIANSKEVDVIVITTPNNCSLGFTPLSCNWVMIRLIIEMPSSA